MTQWDQYVSYRCRHPECQEACLNLIATPYAQTKQCRECYHEHDTDELSSLSHHLPESHRSQIPEPASSD